jgi:hypothetical protein
MTSKQDLKGNDDDPSISPELTISPMTKSADTNGGAPAAGVPLIAAILGISTVAFTLFSHMIKNLEPPIPTISMTACRPGSVESFTFTIGLCCSACLLVMTGFILSWRYPSKKLVARASFWSGIIAAAGLAVTSAVPLQPDIMEVLKLPRANRIMTIQSLVHQYSANIFFLGALLHSILYTIHLRSVAKESKQADGVNQASLRMKYLTIVLSCCFILSPLLLMMYPQIIKGSRVTIIAVNQYGAILALLCFFGTYALDLRGYRIRLEKNTPIKED